MTFDSPQKLQSSDDVVLSTYSPFVVCYVALVVVLFGVSWLRVILSFSVQYYDYEPGEAWQNGAAHVSTCLWSLLRVSKIARVVCILLKLFKSSGGCCLCCCFFSSCRRLTCLLSPPQYYLRFISETHLMSLPDLGMQMKAHISGLNDCHARSCVT